MGTVYLDLKKAFGTVNHEVLINKLSNYNFSPKVIKWINNTLLIENSVFGPDIRLHK